MTSDSAATWWTAGVSRRAARVGTRAAPTRREQGHEHAGGLGLKKLVTVARPPAQEGCTEHEKKSPKYRADEGGLDHGREAGAERENGYQQLGQVADARLEQTRRAGA